MSRASRDEDDAASPRSRPQLSLPHRSDLRVPSREEVRERLEDLFPEGTRGRHLLRFAQLSKRDAWTFAELVQQHWAAWGSTNPGRSYQWWSFTHGPHSRSRRAQARFVRNASQPLAVHVIVDAVSANESDLEHTIRTL